MISPNNMAETPWLMAAEKKGRPALCGVETWAGERSERVAGRKRLTPCSFAILGHQTVFYSRNKLTNNIFSHDKSAKRTCCQPVDHRWSAQVRCGPGQCTVNNEKPVSRAGFANKPQTRREYIFAEPSDYEFVARLWVANKKYLVTNVMSSAVLWSL
jgi:hypothetical protein